MALALTFRPNPSVASLAGIMLLLWATACNCRQAREATASSVPVTVAAAVRKPIPVQITAIGTVQPIVSVTVRSQMDGSVERVNFVGLLLSLLTLYVTPVV